jgi:hypothetical protein
MRLGVVTLVVLATTMLGCDSPGLSSHTSTTSASLEEKGSVSGADWSRMVARGRKHGTVDPAAVQLAVQHEMPGRLRTCYLSALRRDPEAHGSIRVLAVIEEDGTVSSVAEDRSSFKDPKMVACVLDVMKTLRVSPPPKGGIVEVLYPISFSPHM